MAARKRRPNRRRCYIVDRPFQLSLVFTALAAMGVTLVIGVGALVVIPDPGALEGFSGRQVRTLLIGASAAHFLLAAGAVSGVVILLSHRVAGPARVLKTAVDALRDGPGGERTRLRRKDYLQPLAASIGSLDERVNAERRAARELLEAFETRLGADALPESAALLRELPVPVEEEPALSA